MTTNGTEFFKGHGTENDFIIVADPDANIELTDTIVAKWCNRRAGIGADGVLRVARTQALLDAGVIERHDVPGSADSSRESSDRQFPQWFMDYRNADGSIAEMCGNGARVFGHFLFAHGYETKPKFDIATRAGIKSIEIIDPENTTAETAQVKVGMGEVSLIGQSVCRFDGHSFAGIGIDVGNPHLACVIPGLTAQELGQLPIEKEPEFDSAIFPQGVNIEIITPLHNGAVSMRVHERGSGETRSCGTGTVATAIAALADQGKTDGTVAVKVPGGEVIVTILANDQSLGGSTGDSAEDSQGEAEKRFIAQSGEELAAATADDKGVALATATLEGPSRIVAQGKIF